MSQLTQIFSDIANSLRSKMGVSTTYKPSEMAGAIDGIDLGITYFNSSSSNLRAEFNSPVVITNNVTNLAGAFDSCLNFNRSINIPNSVTNMTGTFSSCISYNQPTNIPDSVTNMVSTFRSCINYNQPVTISNNVTNMAMVFNGCRDFNQPVITPNTILDLQNAFRGCISLNSSITISSRATNLSNAFAQCINFNQPVVIPAQPNSDTTHYDCNVENMFAGCISLNQPIIIGRTYADHIAGLLSGCSSFGSTITFENPYHNIINAKGALDGTNNLLKKSIIGSSYTINSIVNKTDLITGGITFTELGDGNGYYNAGYNVYLYNNYSG